MEHTRATRSRVTCRANVAAQVDELDYAQTARFALIGLTLHGPYFLFGFRLIDKIPMGSIKSALGRSLTKTIVTQGCRHVYVV